VLGDGGVEFAFFLSLICCSLPLLFFFFSRRGPGCCEESCGREVAGVVLRVARCVLVVSASYGSLLRWTAARVVSGLQAPSSLLCSWMTSAPSMAGLGRS
jgi:hypothetical protein